MEISQLCNFTMSKLAHQSDVKDMKNVFDIAVKAIKDAGYLVNIDRNEGHLADYVMRVYKEKDYEQEKEQ